MKVDLTGQKFGRLLVLEDSMKRTKHRYVLWLCKCDCGNEIPVIGRHLTIGNTKSCGCLRKEVSSKRSRVHGMADTKTYIVWKNMLERCRNISNKNYGGRGITVCERWLKFENFYDDMGESLGGLTIERINNQGNYELNNCKWASRKEQANNTRTNHFIEY